jgi:hypothetical protein
MILLTALRVTVLCVLTGSCVVLLSGHLSFIVLDCVRGSCAKGVGLLYKVMRSALLGRNEIATFRRLFLSPSSRHTDKGHRPSWRRCVDSCEGFSISWPACRVSDEEDRTSCMQPAPSSFNNTSSIERTGSRTQLHLYAFRAEVRLFERSKSIRYQLPVCVELFFFFVPYKSGHSKFPGLNFSQVIAYSE